MILVKWQAFLKYFCKCELDDENVSLLLKMTSCPAAQFTTLVAIRDIHIIRAPLINEQSKVLTGLVTCLHHADVPFCKKRQRMLCGKVGEVYQLILNEEGELAGLVKSLVGLVRSLWGLVRSLRGLVRSLWGLVRSLAKAGTPVCRRAAADALRNLAGGPDSSNDRIRKEEGVLGGLVNSLSNDGIPPLHEAAAAAVALAN